MASLQQMGMVYAAAITLGASAAYAASPPIAPQKPFNSSPHTQKFEGINFGKVLNLSYFNPSETTPFPKIKKFLSNSRLLGIEKLCHLSEYQSETSSPSSNSPNKIDTVFYFEQYTSPIFQNLTLNALIEFEPFNINEAPKQSHYRHIRYWFSGESKAVVISPKSPVLIRESDYKLLNSNPHLCHF